MLDERGLQKHPLFINKVIQLYETYLVRWGAGGRCAVLQLGSHVDACRGLVMQAWLQSLCLSVQGCKAE